MKPSLNIKKLALPVMLCMACGLLSASEPVQWADRGDGNQVVDAKNLPADLNAIEPLWVTPYDYKKGSGWTYAQPSVVDGRVYVGFDSDGLRDPRLKSLSGGGGALRCLDAATGEILWEAVFPHGGYSGGTYGTGYPPVVEGERLYIRGIAHVFCLDVHGQANGNDGPFTDELDWLNKTKRAGKAPTELLPTDFDIIWVHEMEKTYNLSFEDGAAGPPLVVGDQLWVPTSHEYGRESPIGVTDSPNIIVVDKATGELIATDDVAVPVVFHGQWSALSKGEVNDRTQVFWGDGYGMLHGFAAPAKKNADGTPGTVERLWWCDANPREYRHNEEGKPYYYSTSKGMIEKYPTDWEWVKPVEEDKHPKFGASDIIATPVFYKGKVYVAIGRDGAYGANSPFGRLICVDPAAGKGDLSESGIVWENRDLGRTQSTVSIQDDLVYLTDAAGTMWCFDANTGETYSSFDLSLRKGKKTGVKCRSQLLADGKIYNYEEYQENFFVFRAGKDLELLSTMELEGGKRMGIATPTATDGLLILSTPSKVIAYPGEGSNLAEADVEQSPQIDSK